MLIHSVVPFRWITLENNKLTNVPKKFRKLKGLIHLNLNKNHLNCIPKEFIRLKKLKYLKLQNNAIFTINTSVIERLSHVTKISLIGNPIFTPKEQLEVLFFIHCMYLSVKLYFHLILEF